MPGKFTVALLFAFMIGGGAVLLLESTPKRQADRAVERCIEIARITESPNSFNHYLSRKLGSGGSAPWDLAPVQSDPAAIYGHTMWCLYGRQR